MTIEEIQKFLDDNNTTLEKYLGATIFTDEDQKELKQKWDAMVVEALYRNFEDTP
jgi:DNA-binding transcriptional MerR regulator